MHSLHFVVFCHRKGKGNGGFVRITVSKKASKAHLKHGDAHPGEAVPGREGFWFDQACDPVEPVHEEFEALDLEPQEWASVSCPAGATVLAGGYEYVTPPGFEVELSQPAKDGVGTYPTYPHYTFTPPEEGWVVRNGDTLQSLIVFVDCLPGSP